jgi:hypothetical protein
MRLLNTRTKTIKEFQGRPPNYAILSHTWDKDEVLFQDFATGDHKWKRGWYKVSNFCRIALRDGWEWVWMDTCCIDKTSSVELSEAINSMFRWYQEADLCYVFLADLTMHDYQNCRWFTRGWTLQELLAPVCVVFLDHSWSVRGTQHTLASQIEESCGLSAGDIKEFRADSASVARRMSWAAKRHTTRTEDQAYSLLGIFGIYMPLLYGEGQNAFKRLQQEILKVSSDETIYLWKLPNSNSSASWRRHGRQNTPSSLFWLTSLPLHRPSGADRGLLCCQ